MSDSIENALPGTLLVILLCGCSRALRPVVECAIEQGYPVLVAGADGGDLEEVANLPVERLRLAAGAGKGSAVLAGAALAKEKGYGAILTIDADGQHDPGNARLLLEAVRGSWPAIVIGAGRKEVRGMRESSLRSNGFSCFWVRLECGQSLPDTRSGFRLYPVSFLTSRKFIDQERGFEVETLVRGAWAGLPLLSVEMPDVSLPAGDRAISPRTFRDYLKLVFLHTVLITRTLLPWPHRRMVPKKDTHSLLSLFSEPLRFFRILCREHASAGELAAASWVGIFLGSLPIIPFGIVTIVYVNHKLHLNKLAGVAASNICVFPFVPFLCVEVGHFLRYGCFWGEFTRQTMLNEIHYRLWEWFLGAVVVGPVIGFGGAALTYMLVRYLRSAPREHS
jgi:uncharacterized protein (DUF2062 family)